ncbi:hypothetical protein MJ575_21830 [Klebsiella pneumoniae]|nr:hypothetical protein MJ575_21830 [Klebsiella pneumoniae]
MTTRAACILVDKKSGKVDGAGLAPNLKSCVCVTLSKARADCLSRPDADRPEQGDA